MNSLDLRYEMQKIVKELAGYAEAGMDEESVFALFGLAERAEKLMGEVK